MIIYVQPDNGCRIFSLGGLTIGQILPPTRLGDYENDNWESQNLNHRRRNRSRRRRRSRKDWNSSYS
jgi:hypothetical protein